MATIDSVASAISILERDWGNHGYTIAGVRYTTHGGCILDVRHRDGSEFVIVTDRHGSLLGYGATVDAALARTTV